MGKRKGRRNRTPDKLTPEVQQVIVDAVAGGVPRKAAAERAGVSDRAVRVWMARGAKERTGPYRSFFAAMKKADADRLAASVARIGAAAAGGTVVERVTTTVTTPGGTVTTKTTEKFTAPQWTADAWYLERRHPDEFALRYRREIEEAATRAVERALKNGTPQTDPPRRPEGAGPTSGGGPDPRDV